MNNLVSVIIPAYNHEKFIQETIKSILHQTYQQIELIVVDDGSTDSTFEKILELQELCEKRFVRFVFKKQENQGLIKTLNSLLDMAQGEYIYPIASDDIASGIAIQELHKFLSQNDEYVLALGENKFIDAQGKVCYWDINKNLVYDINQAYYYSYSDYMMKWATNINFFSDDFGSYQLLLLGNHIPNGYLVRKSAFDKVEYYTQKAPLEDYYMALQLAKIGKFKYIPETLFYYRWHGANTITQLTKMKEYGNITRKYEFELVKNSTNSEIKKQMQNYINSFPKEYLIKIPFVFEIYKLKSSWVEKTVLKVFGIKIFTKSKF